jgi:hypothetical protein
MGPPRAAGEINEATVRQPHRCEFMDGALDVVLIGGPGTGKAHVATALTVQAVEHHRRKVRFFSDHQAHQHARPREGKRQSWETCRKPRPPWIS